MILANNILFVAGPSPQAVYTPQPPGEMQKAFLVAISASDGAELAQYQLDSLPVFDGIVAAYGRLYISMKDGRLLCLAEE
jgi:hypothetical protein